MDSKRERMKKAIQENAGKSPAKKVVGLPARVAAAAKKSNPRTAEARDARAKARGRLPCGWGVEAHWNGKEWVGQARVQYETGSLAPMVAWEFTHKSDGLFRLMEEIDVEFWQWAASHPEDALALKWPTEDVKPEPYPKEKP